MSELNRRHLSTLALVGLSGREYINEIKARLRDEESWPQLLEDEVAERTRWGLTRLIESIDDQKERASRSDEYTSVAWLNSVNTLQGLARHRLATMNEPVSTSTSREARAWRGFAAELAQLVAEVNPSALRGVRTPYGGLDAREWLDARNEKQAKQRGAR